MRKLLQNIGLLVCVFIPQIVTSQTIHNAKPHFSYFSIADGLSQNNVSCIFQDTKGYLWIGTHAGLNRYNGKHFEVFVNDPEDSLSISDNTISGISEDVEQNIWVATENGLNKYNRETNTFERYFYNKQNPQKSISDNVIHTVYCDNDGNIWIKTPESIDKINPLTKEIRKYKYDVNLFTKESDNYIHPLYQDKQGTLWFGTKEGLGYFDPEADEIIFYRHDDFKQSSLSNNEVRCIFEDSYNTIWIGTTHGLNSFNRHTKKFNAYFYNTNSLNTINNIIEGSPGELWLATNNDGLLQFNTKNQTFIHYVHSSIENSISTNQTNCIIKDRSDILWIGTRNGLNKLDIKPKKFTIITDNTNSADAFTNITTLYANNTHVFIGTKFNGLFIYSISNKQSKQFSSQLKNYPDSYITSIYPLSNNELLISGDNSFVIYTISKQSYEPITQRYPEITEFLKYNKRIRCILKDSQQNIWIGTSNGIYVYSISTKKIAHYENNANKELRFASGIINTIIEDSNNTIWIGTDKGLTKYNPSSKTFTIVAYTHNLAFQNTSNKVFTLCEDAEKNIWIGTNAGLFKCNPDTETSTLFTEKNGLPNNQIFAILKHNNMLWISTNKGLGNYNIKTNIFKRFYPSDGIQGYEFSQNAAWKSPNGTMFFGGSQGVNMFQPDSIYDNPIAPNLEIQKIVYYINNQKVTIAINNKKYIRIPWQNNTVSIHFAALEFTQPYKNHYKYIIEGIDKEWHDIENQNQINISNLPSGKYTLKILGSNNDLIWGHERILEIEVDTPIWKTIWALILYVVVFIIVLFIFIESRTSSLKKANKSLTEKQEAALEIAKQKEELILKNKNITDSITYAKRIQWAIMPSRAKFKQLLPESCILYMPKDIVSGDFYWITEIQDKIFIAAVDCTGHGVPGAFMSIIGYDLLRNITKERKIFKPSEILDYLNKALIELLTKNEMEDDTVKDGMDMSICVFHKTKGILEYAGAFNPLYIIRDGKIMTIKGDRFSVGLGNEHEDVPFKNHIIKVQKGDTFYLFTDGYADQFGWQTGKKMKFRRFRHIILSVYKLPFTKQVKALRDALQDWKGDLEQIDDILIVGFKLDNYLDAMYSKPTE
jgi:ligand-binding sensor domain-containing protein/serine phosphatase RsbU (regulator of sigma subunit)